MNWLMKLAGPEEYLASLGASPETIQWIMSQPNYQLYIDEYRRNPGTDFSNFKPKQQYEPTFRENQRILQYEEGDPRRKWVLSQLRKMRGRPQPFKNGEMDYEYQMPLAQFDNKMMQIDDWYTTNNENPNVPNIDIHRYTWERAVATSDAWHAAVAGEGAGLLYEPTDPELVMFNPPEWDGWSIQKLVSENDLKAEGNKMDHCFAAGALVRCINGFVPIENIKIGNLVLCESGSYNKVSNVFCNEYSGEMIRLSTRFGVEEILVTPNHEFKHLIPLHKGNKKCNKSSCGNQHRIKDIDKNHKIDWCPIGDLTDQDYILSHVPLEFYDVDHIDIIGDKSPISVNEEFLWVCGMYIAEGSINTDYKNNQKNAIQFSLSAHELDYANRIRSFFENLGLTVRIRKDRPEYQGLVLLINSRVYANLFSDMFGTSSDTKKIPPVLFNLPNEKIVHLVSGIMDGDGHKKRNVLHQTSKILALQMTEIGLRLGICPTNSINYQENKKVSFVTENVSPSIKRAVRGDSNRYKNIWNHKHCRLIKPKISKEYFTGLVYNLEVENIHSYTVQNILVHNCVGEFCRRVSSGDTEIYSLRDSNNEPHVTIELTPKYNEIGQVMGKANSEPKDEYKEMITEWFVELQKQRPGLRMADQEFDFDELRYTEHANLDTRITEIVYGGENYENYGLKIPLDELDIQDPYDAVVRELSGGRYARDDTRDAYYIGPVLAQIAWDADKHRAQLLGLIPGSDMSAEFSDMSNEERWAKFKIQSRKLGVQWLYNTMAKNNEEFGSYFMDYDPYQRREDFYSDEEYEQAIDAERDDAEMQARSESIPTALDNEIYKALNELIKEDPFLPEHQAQKTASNNWKYTFSQSKPALDPDAYNYEETPHRLTEHLEKVPGPFGWINQKKPDEQFLEDNYRGVHASQSFNLAAVYANNRSKEGDPGVVIEFATSQRWENDIDANRDLSDQLYSAINSIKEIDGIEENIQAFEDGKLGWDYIEELFEEIEYMEDDYYAEIAETTTSVGDMLQQNALRIMPSDIADFFKQYYSTQQPIQQSFEFYGNVPDHIRGFYDNFLRPLFVGGEMEDTLKGHFHNQMRFLSEIGDDEIVAVYEISPWKDEMLDYLDDGDYPETEMIEGVERQVVTYDDAHYWEPDSKTIWESPSAEQMRRNGVYYHGTSLSRAQKALSFLNVSQVVASSESWIQRVALLPEDLTNGLNLLHNERQWRRAMVPGGLVEHDKEGWKGKVVEVEGDPVNGGRVFVDDRGWFSPLELSPVIKMVSPFRRVNRINENLNS